jgi:hypothetical protein
MHDMAIMMQCNLSKLSEIGIPTHIYCSSCFTIWQFKYWLTWQIQDMCELHKIKWSGESVISNSQLLHMLLIRCNANYHITTWCKMQKEIWMSYSHSKHFSDKLSYKTYFNMIYRLKDMDINRFKRAFQKNRHADVFDWCLKPNLTCEAELDWRRLKLRLTKGGDFCCRGFELGGLDMEWRLGIAKQEAVTTWASILG